MNKQILAGLVSLAVLASATTYAFAQVPQSFGPMGGQPIGTTTTFGPGMNRDQHMLGLVGSSTPSFNEHRPAPKGIVAMINVGPNGKTQLRGKLTAVSTTTLTISSWGITFTVDASHAQVTGSSSSVSSFPIGDFIGVIGTAATDNATMITAQVVRDWSGPAPKGMMQLQSREDRGNGSSTPENLPPFGDNHGPAGSTTPMMNQTQVAQPPMGNQGPSNLSGQGFNRGPGGRF